MRVGGTNISVSTYRISPGELRLYPIGVRPEFPDSSNLNLETGRGQRKPCNRCTFRGSKPLTDFFCRCVSVLNMKEESLAAAQQQLLETIYGVSRPRRLDDNRACARVSFPRARQGRSNALGNRRGGFDCRRSTREGYSSACRFAIGSHRLMRFATLCNCARHTAGQQDWRTIFGSKIENAAIALQTAHQAYAAAVESRDYQQQLLQAEIDKFAVGVSTNFMLVEDEAYLAQSGAGTFDRSCRAIRLDESSPFSRPGFGQFAEEEQHHI